MTDTFCNYTLLAEIGAGGMGRVYRARNEANGQIVALKVLAPHLVKDPELRKRFLREPALYPQHANIVQIYDAGECNGTPYFAMQIIEGESLEKRLGRERRLAPEVVLSIVRDVAAAMDAAHARNIVHRDIKPNNVLIRASDGRAFLTDFGIARDLAAMTHTGSLGMRIGTVLYMSPEQAKGVTKVTPSSDIYSLGVLCYHLLCGRPPFVADSDVAVLRMHMDEPPPDPRKLGVSPALTDVLLKALAKTPEKRFASAGELAHAFTRALTPPSQPLRALPPYAVPVIAGAAMYVLGIGSGLLLARATGGTATQTGVVTVVQTAVVAPAVIVPSVEPSRTTAPPAEAKPAVTAPVPTQPRPTLAPSSGTATLAPELPTPTATFTRVPPTRTPTATPVVQAQPQPGGPGPQPQPQNTATSAPPPLPPTPPPELTPSK